jgi:hypothetical protein
MDLIRTTLSLSVVNVRPSGNELGGQAFMEHYTDPTFHIRVISFDKAVRQRVGSTHDLELSEHDRFSDIKLAHTNSIRASVTLSSQTSGNKSNKIFI